MDDEIVWLPVTGYEDLYEVSSSGLLRKGDREVACGINRGGYVKARLMRDGVEKHTTMHRIVALAFLGDPLCEGLHINHINGVKTDNKPENLEWVTAKENVQHAVRTKLFAQAGEGHWKAKLFEGSIQAIKEARANGVPLKELAADYGVSMSTISAVATGRTWRTA